MLQFITLLSVGGSSVVGGWLVGWLVVGCCVVGGEYNGVAATACPVLCTIFNVCH